MSSANSKTIAIPESLKDLFRYRETAAVAQDLPQRHFGKAANFTGSATELSAASPQLVTPRVTAFERDALKRFFARTAAQDKPVLAKETPEMRSATHSPSMFSLVKSWTSGVWDELQNRVVAAKEKFVGAPEAKHKASVANDLVPSTTDEQSRVKEFDKLSAEFDSAVEGILLGGDEKRAVTKGPEIGRTYVSVPLTVLPEDLGTSRKGFPGSRAPAFAGIKPDTRPKVGGVYGARNQGENGSVPAGNLPSGSGAEAYPATVVTNSSSAAEPTTRGGALDYKEKHPAVEAYIKGYLSRYGWKDNVENREEAKKVACAFGIDRIIKEFEEAKQKAAESQPADPTPPKTPSPSQPTRRNNTLGVLADSKAVLAFVVLAFAYLGGVLNLSEKTTVTKKTSDPEASLLLRTNQTAASHQKNLKLAPARSMIDPPPPPPPTPISIQPAQLDILSPDSPLGRLATTTLAQSTPDPRPEKLQSGFPSAVIPPTEAKLSTHLSPTGKQTAQGRVEHVALVDEEKLIMPPTSSKTKPPMPPRAEPPAPNSNVKTLTSSPAPTASTTTPIIPRSTKIVASQPKPAATIVKKDSPPDDMSELIKIPASSSPRIFPPYPLPGASAKLNTNTFRNEGSPARLPSAGKTQTQPPVGSTSNNQSTQPPATPTQADARAAKKAEHDQQATQRKLALEKDAANLRAEAKKLELANQQALINNRVNSYLATQRVGIVDLANIFSNFRETDKALVRWRYGLSNEARINGAYTVFLQETNTAQNLKRDILQPLRTRITGELLEVMKLYQFTGSEEAAKAVKKLTDLRLGIIEIIDRLTVENADTVFERLTELCIKSGYAPNSAEYGRTLKRLQSAIIAGKVAGAIRFTLCEDGKLAYPTQRQKFRSFEEAKEVAARAARNLVFRYTNRKRFNVADYRSYLSNSPVTPADPSHDPTFIGFLPTAVPPMPNFNSGGEHSAGYNVKL